MPTLAFYECTCGIQFKALQVDESLEAKIYTCACGLPLLFKSKILGLWFSRKTRGEFKDSFDWIEIPLSALGAWDL
jgi:hypothetical protein